MIKDLLLDLGNPTVPHEQIRHYVEFSHAPRALKCPVISRHMTRFTLNHVLQSVARDCCLYAPIEGLVIVPEHYVGGWEGFNRIITDEQYLADVRPDEEHMIENLFNGSPQFLEIDEEVTIFSSGPSRGLRMFEFLRRPAAISREEFSKKLEEDGRWAAAQPTYRHSVVKRVHGWVSSSSAPIGALGEPFDAVVEAWISDAARLAALVTEHRARRAGFCDIKRSFSAVTEERVMRG